MDVMELLQRFLLEQAMILVPVLIFFGYVLKKTPFIANWLIPWLLTVLGIIGGMAILGINVTAVLQGIVATGMAVFGHQLFKQLKNQD